MSLDGQEFRALLLARKAELEDDALSSEAARAPVALEQDAVGRLSRIDAIQMQAMALAQQRRREGELNAIAAALGRIEQGEFGACLTCGADIAEQRLRLNPVVVACIACARDG